MKKDIGTREDIAVLMQAFYTKAIPDPVIGHFFTDVVHMDLAKHLPVITDFWESLLLDKPALYKNNAMQPHMHMHARSPMRKMHFDRWLQLFNETVDSMFAGEIAFKAKERATSIATVMQIKMAQQNQAAS